MSGIRQTKYNARHLRHGVYTFFNGDLLKLYNSMPSILLQNVECKLLKVKLSHIIKLAFTWLLMMMFALRISNT